MFHDIAIDPSSNSVYLCGSASGEVFIGSSKLSTGRKGQQVGTLAKADFDGNFIWAKSIAVPASMKAGDYAEVITDVVVHQGDVFVNGRLIASGASYDAYFSRLTANGNVVWATKIGSSYRDQSYRLAINASGNMFSNVTLGASAQLGASLRPAGSYIAQFNTANGQVVDSWRLGDNYQPPNSRDPNPVPGVVPLEGLTVDPQGNLWGTSGYYGTNTFPDGTTLTSSGKFDLFLVKFANSSTAAAAPLVMASSAIATDPSATLRTATDRTAARGSLDLHPAALRADLHDAVFDHLLEQPFASLARKDLKKLRRH